MIPRALRRRRLPHFRGEARADAFGFADLVTEALADVGARPARLVMTLAGAVLGIGALVVTIGFAQTTATHLARQFDATAATQLSVTPAQAQTPSGETVDAGTLPEDAVARVERLVGVTRAATLTPIAATEDTTVTAVPVNDPSAPRTTPPPLFAASPEILDTVDARIVTGRAYDAGHEQRADRVAVLGAGAADALGVNRITSQPSIFIDGLAFAVLGIFDTPQLRGDLTNAILLPTSTARADFHVTTTAELLSRIAIGTGPQLRTQTALTLAPDDPDTLDVSAPAARSELGQTVQADVNVVFLILSVVVLLAAGVGIANVTTLSVMERIGEIGLRRAVGATRAQISGQFITESAIIGLLGGLVGAAVGVSAVLAISLTQQWTPIVHPFVPLGGVALGAILGLAAGGIPARRAARIEPIDALRTA